ncbi:hypothetical protein, partial [Shewanella algae]|uniref:hypothetical protein n=1 Tax=Shewanella algae TaxID=38313 RepID=UPI001F38067D
GPLCVIDTSLTLVPEKSKLEAVANSVDTALVAVQLHGYYDDDDVYITASLNDGASANLTASSVKVDENGIAIFELDSIKAEMVTLTAELGGSHVGVDVAFVGDIYTATLALATTDEGLDEVTATLKDQHSNPLSGYSASFKALDYTDSIAINPDRTTDVNGNQKAYLKWNGGLLHEPLTVSIQSEFTRPDTVLLEAKTEVTFAPLICGGVYNDRGKSNAYCIKVASVGEKLYSGSPSMSFLERLGGFEKATGLIEKKRTYKGTYFVDGEEFAVFEQRTSRYAGLTQANRFCSVLNEIALAGRVNWTQPSVFEFSVLYNARGNMYSYGWPGDGFDPSYWTSDRRTDTTHYRYYLTDGNGKHYSFDYEGLFAGCYSEG